jgi:ATP-dependent RNA helicase DeaD
LSTFKSLGLSSEVLKVLSELGFEKPTEIQEHSIPQLLQGNRDFIGLAQTGTGKTAAFGLPLIEQVNPKDKSTQALVLAPTRELGQQIAEQLHTFSKYKHKVNVLAVYGGAAISNQIRDLRKPQHIIIATPGRLIDLIKRKAVKLDKLRFLVLDEADEMLNMGFQDELNEILSYTPDNKLTWLFSATMPKEIRRIVQKYMHEPEEVKVNTKNEVNANIEHQYTVVKRADKTEALFRFLDVHVDMRGLVFCRTKRETQQLAEELMGKGYKADALHGDMSQAQRDRVMKRFKAHKLQVLIATDVAARGIDVNDLTHVFHFTLPDDMSYYTHRSGRTARAGKEGISIAFINGRENGKIRRLEKTLGISFQKVPIPDASDVADQRIESWSQEILDTKSKKLDPELLEKVNIMFGNLSKEELTAKFLARELQNLNLESTKDLNDIHGKRNKRDKQDRNERGNRQERRKNKDKKPREKSPGSDNGNPRFFINLGKRDHINKTDLLHFICDIAKLEKRDVNKIDLQQSHSYFEVNAQSGKNVANMFKGLILEDGRELRVNRDN